MSWETALAVGGAFLLSWSFVGAWISFSLRAKILDVPGERSSHSRPTPRGGGVGIVAAVLAVGAGMVATGRVAEPLVAFWCLALGSSVALISFVDDVRSLSSVLRLCCHAVLAVAAVRLVGPFSGLVLPWGGVVPAGMLLDAVAVIWIVGLTNVYNFMDGIDGIAGGQGMVAGLAWAAAGHVWGMPALTTLGVGIAAACAGFLVHNWSPARVFMGDVGSAFLGFLFAVLPLLALRLGMSSRVETAIPVFAGCVVWPFIADGVFTFIRRVRYRENVLKAHRSHLYQRLIILGWTHAAVSRIYIGWAVVSLGCGMLYLGGGIGARVVAVVVLFGSLFAVRTFVNAGERRASAQGARLRCQTIV